MPAVARTTPSFAPVARTSATRESSAAQAARSNERRLSTLNARVSSVLPQRSVATESEGGKRTYRMSDGRTIELPPDMTAEEAAKLEAEAKTAQQKLGKGPPPKPVPDVRKLARKEAAERRGRQKRRAKACEGRRRPGWPQDGGRRRCRTAQGGRVRQGGAVPGRQGRARARPKASACCRS